MQYYATTASNGNIAFYNDDVNGTDIPSEAIDITEEQWQDALTNPGKYSIVNGVLTAASVWPPVQTTDQKIAALDAEYQPQFKSLAESLGLATLDGSQTVIDSIKSDYAALKTEYNIKREAINND